LALRVLVADDERPVRMVADVVLRRAGYSVELCVDGTIATERFKADPASFALAVVDLSMPGRTGRELIADMRALRPDLPVILMSGDHSRYDPAGKAPVPNVLRLPKPFSIDELLAALRRITEPAK
jgi:CheY-like chemotaxis protein